MSSARTWRVAAAAAFAGAVLISGLAILAPRKMLRILDVMDLRDSVNIQGMPLSPGHADLVASNPGGCFLCHVAHRTQGHRALWQGNGQAGMPGNGEAVVGAVSSRLCLSCHDGLAVSNIPGHAMIDAFQPKSVDLGRPHPVDMDYLSAVRRAPGAFIDPSMNPRIFLDEGRVGCISCHSAHEPAALAANGVRHEVCIECHRR